jgi:glycosyltransferase involved in cell wall biosynthesis/ubiquinone/menaquinone biosynthesis C-methylase UbiE/Flp pilus assembly protein TadD
VERMDDEVRAYQQKLKENINILINENRLDEAKELLNHYEKIIKDDIELYSIKAVIFIIENKLESAEHILLEGVKRDCNNFDMLYNLAYVYELMQNNKKACQLYERLLTQTKDKNMVNVIKEGINRIIETKKGLDFEEEVSLDVGKQMNIYQGQVRNNIRDLINANNLSDAKILLDEYEGIVRDDIEIYSMKAVIAILEDRLEDAKGILINGLNIDNNNFDLNYNLGYTYFNQGIYNQAFRYYTKAKELCSDPVIFDQLGDVLHSIKVDHGETLEKYPNGNFKKVLIIAHIFPPVGGSGVQRTLKFVKYLSRYGWEPIVVTVGSTGYPLKDETLLKEVPKNIRIIRIDEISTIDNNFIKELVELQTGMIGDKTIIESYIKELNQGNEKLKSLLLTPDSYIVWANLVLKCIEEKLEFSDIDVIYSTSGPYSDHIIGYYLKKRFNKPWVADFRDEWTNNPYAKYNPDSIKYKMEWAMENVIVQCADRVITTTPKASENYRRIFSLDNSKVVTITNGYDESDFEGLNDVDNHNDQFTIIHNGLLYGIRTPVTFLKAISNLIQKQLVDIEKLTVYFAWGEEDNIWIDVVNKMGLAKCVKFLGYMTHKESLRFASQSDVLLMIVGPGEKNKAMYPGKIFEYLRLNKPILSLSPIGGVVDSLIKETNRGCNVDFNDVKGMERYILKLYTDWYKNKKPNLITDERVKKYERILLTEKLSSTLTEVVNNVKEPKKLVFFAIPNGGDKFLGDIINSLTEEYEIRKVIVTDLRQIEEAMGWADVCWFEWCDYLIDYASKLPVAREKKIICRIHRYEVFTNNVTKVNWENVDKLIVVTEHLIKLIEMSVPNIRSRVSIVAIQNGVDMNRYEFTERIKGYNIAYVGDIIYRKNPFLLIQIVEKLVKQNRQYKLYVAGNFKDPLIKMYWDYHVKEMGLENNVIFDGWQSNINEWLKDKNYLLAPTIHESFGFFIAEAMACGIKPVVHNFLYAKELWPERYLFNTIDEAVEIIKSNQYLSGEYRDYIEENYSLEWQLSQTRELLHELFGHNEEKSNGKVAIDYNDYLIAKNNEFIPYKLTDIDNYNFSDVSILIGKKELINQQTQLVDCIIQNKEDKKLLLMNVLYNKNLHNIMLPPYLDNSINRHHIKSIIDKCIRVKVKYINNIGGFVLDDAIKLDIKNNIEAYGWERGIPATQFISAAGYLRIIERYLFARRFIKETDTVLEAACGYGYGAAFLSKFCSKIEALDLAKDNIEFCKNVYDFNNIKWCQGDVTELPFDDRSFDVYVTFETLEHLPLNMVTKYLTEACRVLKPGGKMIISTPNNEMRKHINNPFHIKEYNFSELNQLLKQFFGNIEYYSSENFMVEKGISKTAINIIAVCEREEIKCITRNATNSNKISD